MKSPRHARPSGDRRIAQAFMQAVELAGCEVELASELRAWEGDGNARRQAHIETRGNRAAARLVTAYRKLPAAARPNCWLTYHLYHKAPDWLGASVSAALGIPYALAEASLARKQCDGAWRRGYAQSLAAVRRADCIFNLNSNDLAGVRAVARDGAVVELKPFLDMPPMPPTTRERVAARLSLDPKPHWLLCVAMMRSGDKLESYRVLAGALARMQRDDWRLLVAGDGPAEQEVRAMFAQCRPGQVHFLGRRARDFIYELMRACDLLVWPACNEAFGMAVLEALGCGLPVVAGRSGGIGDIVAHDVTGMLVAPNDARAMAAAIGQLLASPARLARMAAASVRAFHRHHRLDAAAEIIGAALAHAARQTRAT
ncbi:MAG: glycosyltransferase family 4 protein [Gammaproteobacteria bacterium]